MQAAAVALQDNLWGNLRKIFDHYAEGKAQIPTAKVETIIREALGQTSQNEIDYVVKNMFRLDQDQSGTVSFEEFGNFLFKRHCGEMSLQKFHKEGKMKLGDKRLMSLPEFNILMDNAYAFLKVSCPPDVAKYCFQSQDKDKDGLITYVEYFRIIDIYVCKPVGAQKKVEEKPVVVAPVGPERLSRFRIHLWTQLRKLYEYYIQGRSLDASDAELKGLIGGIVGDLSSADITFIATRILELNFKKIEFVPFAQNFLYIISELGLSRFAGNHSNTKKSLNKEEFALLLRNTFKFLNVFKIKDSLLFAIFAKIDKNHDGLITFEEYLDWVRRFLAVLKYFGDEFWVDEDDYDKYGEAIEKEVIVPVVIETKRDFGVKFIFSDYTLAGNVRERVLQLLIPYDVNQDKHFDQKEIQNALVGLLKENEFELAYVTRNVFRYDRDGDKNVTYTELTNFCVQQHFGEMAIQRLHRKGTYQRGKERIMNKEEFGITLNNALHFITMEATPAQIDLLFSEIDLDHDGWISYEVYFLFLKYYFGSLSLCVINKPVEVHEVILSDDEKFLLSLANLSVWDRFWRIYYDQLKAIFLSFDANKNLVFEPDEIEAILSQVFKLSPNEISYIMYTFFNLDTQKHLTFDELLSIILSIYFIEIVLKRRYQEKNSEVWNSRRISLQEFLLLISEESFFIRTKPPKADLILIFETLDTDKDGFITFEQYINFIKQYLGKGIELTAKPAPVAVTPQITAPAGVSQEELLFVEAIWGELKKYFDEYDQGHKGYLNEAEMKKFVIEVLNETSQRELDYVFWNFFRIDPNANRQVEFNQFAPFILNHAGEISLQRFHREQIKGKSALTEDELFVVIGNAYKFLSTMPKQRGVITMIYKRLGDGKDVTYAGLLNWVHRSLSNKFR